MTDIDYESVHVPLGKEPDELTYAERRADLLRRIRQVGGPMFLPDKSDLAKEYGVSRQTVHKDLRKLGEYVDDNLGDGEALELDPFLWRCAKNLFEKGEEHKAAKVALNLSEWRRLSELEDLEDRLTELEERIAERSDYRST